MRIVVEYFRGTYGCPCCGDTEQTREWVEILYAPCGGVEKIIHHIDGCCASQSRQITTANYFKLRRELGVERVENREEVEE